MAVDIGGEGSDHILFRGDVFTPKNFWPFGDKKLKFYMVIEIHKLFWKTEIFVEKC